MRQTLELQMMLLLDGVWRRSREQRGKHIQQSQFPHWGELWFRRLRLRIRFRRVSSWGWWFGPTESGEIQIDDTDEGGEVKENETVENLSRLARRLGDLAAASATGWCRPHGARCAHPCGAEIYQCWMLAWSQARSWGSGRDLLGESLCHGNRSDIFPYSSSSKERFWPKIS